MKTERNLFACLLLSLFLTACGGGGNDGGGGGGGDSGKKLLSKLSIEDGEERVFQYDEQNRLIWDNSALEASKIEYQSDDTHPLLVTREISGATVGHVLYQYGAGDLDGAPTKYYQTQALDQNGNPLSPDDVTRYYLNQNDKIIVVINTSNIPSEGIFPEGNFRYLYDESGNLLKRTEIRLLPTLGTFETVLECTYDDKKSPASGMATPLWWFWESGGNAMYASTRFNFLLNPNNPLSCTTTTARYGIVTSSTNEIYRYTYNQDSYPMAVDVTRTSHDDQGVEQTTTYRKTFEYLSAH